MSTVPVIAVSGVIRLGQFLKLAGLVEDGAMARVLIQGGDVLVNGVVETRRGRQLSHDDMIEVDSPAGRAGARIHVID
ncbi:RNA-binding S4 domain-containing protein [Schaalia cardiffensis]|uniref:RNA-binding S4 domain-containing protein n=1 Tax=Schaalia cardiffensis TaxID=181487 RepID=UPI002AB2EAC3|nr:RNA-binding S4 domain-containing protein [Schaalia cardiffensis]